MVPSSGHRSVSLLFAVLIEAQFFLLLLLLLLLSHQEQRGSTQSLTSLSLSSGYFILFFVSYKRAECCELKHDYTIGSNFSNRVKSYHGCRKGSVFMGVFLID